MNRKDKSKNSIPAHEVDSFYRRHEWGVKRAVRGVLAFAIGFMATYIMVENYFPAPEEVPKIESINETYETNP